MEIASLSSPSYCERGTLTVILRRRCEHSKLNQTANQDGGQVGKKSFSQADIT